MILNFDVSSGLYSFVDISYIRRSYRRKILFQPFSVMPNLKIFLNQPCREL